MSISIKVAQEKFSISNKTKDRLPGLSFVLMKEKVLGKDYDLSLVFIDEKKIQEWCNSIGFKINYFKYQNYKTHTIFEILDEKDFIICEVIK